MGLVIIIFNPRNRTFIVLLLFFINIILFQKSCQSVSLHDGGLYVGGIGVAWAALRVMQRLDEGFETFLPHVRAYVERIVNKAAQDAPRDNEERFSFLLGMPGVWLTAACLYHVRSVSLINILLRKLI